MTSVPFRLTALLSLSLILGGCATSVSSFAPEHIPAPPNQVDNEIVVDGEFDVVWDRLVSGLAQTFFVINNIEKDSRLINASISSQNPEQLIDCGTTKRAIRRGSYTTRFEYPIAASSTYTVGQMVGALKNASVVANVQRTTSLESIVNVFVAPVEGSDHLTRVRVNARYVLSVLITGTYEGTNAFGNVAERGMIPNNGVSTPFAFSTNEHVEHNFGTPESPTMAVCYSNGTLESAVLDILR